MNLSEEEIKKVSFLARLDLSDSELSQYTGELSSILGHIDSLSELSTDDIQPLAQTLTTSSTHSREDFEHNGVVIEEFRGRFASNVPDMEGEFFRVPQIKKSTS